MFSPDVTEFSKRAYDQDLVAMSRETFDLEQAQSQAQASEGKLLTSYSIP